MSGDKRFRISSREALRFLMEAGNRLSSTLDYESTLQSVAELSIPRIASYCVVDISEGGALRRVATAHVDPAGLDILRKVTMPPISGSILWRRLAAGAPLLISPVTDAWLREVSTDEENLELHRRLGGTSAILVPLAARGKVLGALVLGSTRTDRFYTERDLDLAAELGRIASNAIDNALLYRAAEDSARAREQVLRMVAHDLRDPIGTISLAASLLLDESPPELLNGPFGATLQSIRNSAARANRLIQDLLDLARSESGRLKVVKAPEPVAQLVRETFEANRHRADDLDVQLRMCNVDSRLLALADRDRVLQVLGNLVGNALKFTPSGGSVTLGAEPRADEVHFFVRDTGKGIAQEDLAHLFDPWWQAPGAEKRGLGLGLAIVKSLVEAHGGQVWINSKPGVGSEINFTVPRFVSNLVQNDEQQASRDQPVNEPR